MTRIATAQSVISRTGLTPMRSKDADPPPVEAIEEDSEEARAFRREIQRKNGRGLFVDKSI